MRNDNKHSLTIGQPARRFVAWADQDLARLTAPPSVQAEINLGL